MTLRARLAVGIVSIAVTLILPLIIALRGLDELHTSAERLADEAFAGSVALRRVQESLDDAQQAENAVLFVHDSASLHRMTTAVAELRQGADSLRARELRAPADTIVAAAKTLEQYAQPEFAAAASRNAADAERVSEQHMRPALASIGLTIHEAERLLQARTQQTMHDAAGAASASRRVAAMSLFAALGIGAVLAVILTRSISRPVRELDRGMRQVADGDLDAKVNLDPHRGDEFGRLASSFATMTAQLAELDRLRSEFMSIATHELKNPINVLIGYAQLLNDEVYGPLNSRQREAVTTVERQAQALNRLVRRLLDVSRFEAGGVSLEIRDINLEQMLRDLHQGFHVLAGERGIALDLDLQTSLPRTVEWDGDRVTEMLGNLIANALNFTPRGGRVTIAAAHVDSRVQLQVRDTGVGISAEQLPHVFEKFYQARNQKAARAKGSGLGLAISKEIVEAHGGSIVADSAQGSGTVFTIMLPIVVTREEFVVEEQDSSQAQEALA